MENIAHYLVVVKRVTPIGFVGQQESRSVVIRYGLMILGFLRFSGFYGLLCRFGGFLWLGVIFDKIQCMF